LLSAEPLAIALPKGLQHESLRQAVEQALGQWQQSGWLRSLAQQWSLPH
jgi:polar amino acid transport system substrate-binding protein